MIDTWVAFDFETSSNNKYTCKIDRVCWAKFYIKSGTIIDKGEMSTRDIEWEDRFNMHVLKGIMNDNSTTKVAHNAGFDLYLLEQQLGIKLNGQIHDTYLMAKHFHNNLPAYNLKTLSWIFFGDTYQPLLKLRQWIHDQNLKGEDDEEFDMTLPPNGLVHKYCMHDVKMTAKLAQFFYQKVKDNYAYQQDTQCIRLNMDMEARGVHVDVSGLKKAMKLAEKRVKYNRNKGVHIDQSEKEV